ncbi:uncharacterized protein LOC135484701 isoform X2 [Lineus longissimus]|uniref:uncharacterized protein LOC135484701 isoform X2 n=1 Tax=Lineus longissimus TaxID=88925 RepID=UPI00315D1110
MVYSKMSPRTVNGSRGSTPAPSKKRRTDINANIERLGQLLIKGKLTQHSIMCLSIIIIRKHQMIQKGLPSFGPASPVDGVNLSEFAGEGGDVTGALTGFMIVTTKDGKLIYLSENVTQYLGHSMVDMLTQGDSIFDIIDKKYHNEFEEKLRDASETMDPHAKPRSDDIILFCQMKVRSQKRQTSSGDQKLMHIKGHLSWLPNNHNEPIFLGICNPLITPDFKDSMVQTSTMSFRTVHQPDMRFKEIWEGVGEFHFGWTNKEIVGHSWYEKIHPDDDMRAREKHKQLFSHGHAPELGCMLTIRMMTKYGHYIWLNLIMHVDHPYANSDESAVIVINQVISDKEAPLYREQSHRYSPNIVPSPEQLPDATVDHVDGHTIRPIINDWPDSYYSRGDVAGYHPTPHQEQYYSRSYGPYPDYQGYQENGEESYVHPHPDVPTVVNAFTVRTSGDPPKNAFMSSSPVLPGEQQTRLPDTTQLPSKVRVEIRAEDSHITPLTPDREPQDEIDGVLPSRRFELGPPAGLPTPDASPLASPVTPRIKQEKGEEYLAELTVDDVKRNLEDELNSIELNQNNTIWSGKRKMQTYSPSNEMAYQMSPPKLPRKKSSSDLQVPAVFSDSDWLKYRQYLRTGQRCMSTGTNDLEMKQKMRRTCGRTRSCEARSPTWHPRLPHVLTKLERGSCSTSVSPQRAATGADHERSAVLDNSSNSSSTLHHSRIRTPSKRSYTEETNLMSPLSQKNQLSQVGYADTKRNTFQAKRVCRPVDPLPIGLPTDFSSLSPESHEDSCPTRSVGVKRNSLTNLTHSASFDGASFYDSRTGTGKQVLPSFSCSFPPKKSSPMSPTELPKQRYLSVGTALQDLSEMKVRQYNMEPRRSSENEIQRLTSFQNNEWYPCDAKDTANYPASDINICSGGQTFNYTYAPEKQWSETHHCYPTGQNDEFSLLNSFTQYSCSPQISQLNQSCSGRTTGTGTVSSFPCTPAGNQGSWGYQGDNSTTAPTSTSEASQFPTAFSSGQQMDYSQQPPLPSTLSVDRHPGPPRRHSFYLDPEMSQSSPMNASVFEDDLTEDTQSSYPTSPESILELTDYPWSN